jgi:hypothetical protein
MKKFILSTILTVGLTGSASASVLTGDLTNGLVAYYKFNGSFNDVTANLSAAVNSGAFFTSDRFGNTNGAIGFNGSQYATIQGLGSVLSGSTGITISGWYFANTPFTSGFIENAYNSSSTSIRFTAYQSILFSNLGVWGNTATINPGWGALVTTDTFQYSKWHQMVGVISLGDKPKLYLDGIECSFQMEPLIQFSPVVFDAPYCIGTSWEYPWGPRTGTGYMMDGAISDLLFYDRAFSSTQVSQLYALQSVPEPSTYALFGIGALALVVAYRRKFA